jgi:glycosyltransferase involved in cell wall biosynthesis
LSKECPIKPNKIVYAGSLGEGYDIETIIELGRIRPDLKIVVAGLGPKKNQCQLAHDMGIIQYLGQISPNDLMQLYGDACIGLLPYSKNSAVSMPIKFFEYLAYELKIVNSLSMECSEIIINNSLGANYIPGDVNSLSKAVDRAINMTQDKNVIRKLNEIFSVKTQYKNFIDAIKKEINLI